MSLQGTAPDADPRGQPDIDRLVSEALEKYTERLLDQLVPSLTTKITEQVMNQIVSRVTSEAKGQVAALSGSLQGSIDSLDSKVADLQQRFTAVEEKQLQPVPSVENVSARLENLQANTSATHDDILARLERMELRDRETSLMVYGLPEEGAAGGAQLQRAVTAKLVEAARSHGFKGASIRSSKRFGVPHDDPARPRPVMVTCQSVDDKHAAFKGRQFLKGQQIKLDDCLTAAQIKRRAAQQPAMAELRASPGANPHFRGDRLFHVKDGRVIPYRPATASQPPGQPADPASSPAHAARSPAHAASSPGSGRAPSSRKSPAAQGSSHAAAPQAPSQPVRFQASVEGRTLPTHLRPSQGRKKRPAKKSSGAGVAQAAADASRPDSHPVPRSPQPHGAFPPCPRHPPVSAQRTPAGVLPGPPPNPSLPTPVA